MTSTGSTTQPSLEQPHTLIFFVASLVALAVAVLPSLWVQDDRKWRRPYWIAVGAAAVCLVLAAIPDWKLGIGMALFGLALMTASAYFYTPFIKIRGTVYAHHVRDSQPDPAPDGSSLPGTTEPDYDPAPDSYSGLTTAKKYWWLLLVTIAICVINVLAYALNQQKPWVAPLAGLGLLVIATGLGYLDASWDYSIARGQRLQFGIAAVMTAGLFTVLYLTAYNAGKRWPLRRKQSMEYRAHPRHQKKYP